MSESAEDIKRQVMDIVHTMFDAFQNHDIDGTDRYLHDDATVWDVFTPQLIRGAQERAAFHKGDQEQMQSRGALTMSIDDPVVDAWGGIALARYYLTFSYEPPNPASGRVRITDVFRKIDGEWMIVHHHEGTVPTGIPPITE